MHDVEKVIREKRPTARDGSSIPIKAPDGWVHLLPAFARLIDALVKDQESDADALLDFCLDVESPAPTGNAELDDWRKLAGAHMAELFAQACYEGHLVTGFRRKGGGSDPVQPISREWWNGMEDPFAPFRTWGFDPDNAANPSPPNWIWVRADTLETQVARARYRGDPGKCLPGVDLSDRGANFEAIPLAKALDVLQRALPAGRNSVSHMVGHLMMLCGSGAVRTLAGHMYRSINTDSSGLGGKAVEAVPTWSIPSRLWQRFQDSPLQDWQAGELIMKDGSDGYRLRHVHVDRVSLFRALKAQGLVEVVKGEEALGWLRLMDDMVWMGYRPTNIVWIPLPPDKVDIPPNGGGAEAAKSANPAKAAKSKRKRGRKINPVWARAFAKAYRDHGKLAANFSDEAFRDWIRNSSPLGAQASPEHRDTIANYRSKAEAGELDHYLSK